MRRLVSGAAIAVLLIVAVSRCDDPPKPSTAETGPVTSSHALTDAPSRSSGSPGLGPLGDAANVRGLPPVLDTPPSAESDAAKASLRRSERAARKTLRRIFGRLLRSNPQPIERRAQTEDIDSKVADPARREWTIESAAAHEPTTARVAALHHALGKAVASGLTDRSEENTAASRRVRGE